MAAWCCWPSRPGQPSAWAQRVVRPGGVAMVHASRASTTQPLWQRHAHCEHAASPLAARARQSGLGDAFCRSSPSVQASDRRQSQRPFTQDGNAQDDCSVAPIVCLRARRLRRLSLCRRPRAPTSPQAAAQVSASAQAAQAPRPPCLFCHHRLDLH